MTTDDPYYRADLARIHHLGFGSHADACAPGILDLLQPVRPAFGAEALPEGMVVLVGHRDG